MKHLFIFAMSCALFLSCKNSSETTNLESSATQEEIQKIEVFDDLQLNHNEKWTVNEEMKPHIHQGEELLLTYKTVKETDHVTLAEKRLELHKNLIAIWTMNGVSLIELHKWLHPHLKRVDTFKNSYELRKIKESIAIITNSYKMYHNYSK